ncbi:AzlC family ABC transporter permease [Clostridium sp. AM58-1XD]|uniref:AzlC family ABC transporter permease n=1 Tax=Clostridium sp. AM58-1XD TaxID=2292307 RepID=UPI0026CFE4E3
MNRNEFIQGMRHGIPICLGYFSVSAAFGMMAVLSGIPLWVVVMISLTNLTSAGQFAGVNLMLAGGTYLELIVSMIVINIRYFLMSLSLSQKVNEKMTYPKRLGISFGITDEIFAVAIQHPGMVTASYMAGLILLPVIGWTGGTSWEAPLQAYFRKVCPQPLELPCTACLSRLLYRRPDIKRRYCSP